jgi:vacuolar-type H+-ATPase subunit F/Vma7
MFEKVAVIGENDLVLGLRALGFLVLSPLDSEQAREMIKGLDKKGVALCFLHQSYFDPLKEERKELVKKKGPVVVGFSDFREITDKLALILRETAVTATGSDSLVKRKV